MPAAEATDMTVKVAGDAITAMARLGIAPTPENYTLWYNHVGGTHPALSEHLKDLERKGVVPADDTLSELHERFFGTARQRRLLDGACEQLKATIGKMMHEVADVSSGSETYGDDLKRFQGDVGRMAVPAEVRSLIDGVLDRTQSMQSRTEAAGARLAETSAVMDGLKDDLNKAEEAAHADPLTGIPNRALFGQKLLGEVREWRYDSPVCLILLGIDRFAAFNQRHGREVGNQVLRLIARFLTQTIKGRDTAARIDGDQFAIILPQTALFGAAQLAEQIRKTVESKDIRLKSSQKPIGRITLSIGCAGYESGEGAESFLKRSAKALAQAKEQGRNQVMMAANPR